MAAAWDIPAAPWATATRSTRDTARILPQAIAHRGFKAEWPENTMAAFAAAVDAGAHAVETDIHLSGDGIAVLSHDATLTRCFGIDRKLADCTWSFLSTLHTIREPKQPLPRLRDLLEWLDGRDSTTWVLLDIKLDDNAQHLIDAIAAALAEVPPSSVKWEQRIVLGCWNASVLMAARKTLPSFPLAHIGYSLSYARQFLSVPHMGFNMAFHTLMRPFLGRRFMRDVKDAGRPLYAWTVNTPRFMEWCIRQNGDRPVIDGVVTDDPARFLKLCERYEDELDGQARTVRNAGLKEALGDTVHLIMRHVVAKLMFVVRRHLQHKLDDLYVDRRTMQPKRE